MKFCRWLSREFHMMEVSYDRSVIKKGVTIMAVITITESNFEQEVLKSDKPVLVDFWASWCGPCKMLSPVVDEIAEATPSIKVGKVNVDEEGGLAQQFKVMSIPTLIFFKDGKVANQTIGVQPKAVIEQMINS